MTAGIAFLETIPCLSKGRDYIPSRHFTAALICQAMHEQNTRWQQMPRSCKTRMFERTKRPSMSRSVHASSVVLSVFRLETPNKLLLESRFSRRPNQSNKLSRYWLNFILIEEADDQMCNRLTFSAAKQSPTLCCLFPLKVQTLMMLKNDNTEAPALFRSINNRLDRQNIGVLVIYGWQATPVVLYNVITHSLRWWNGYTPKTITRPQTLPRLPTQFVHESMCLLKAKKVEKSWERQENQSQIMVSLPVLRPMTGTFRTYSRSFCRVVFLY